MKRGEIWWAEYPEPAGRRPVVIVQSDRFNASAIGTVLAVPLTSTLRLGAAPGNVVLNKRESRLTRESVANVSQLGVLPKGALTQRVCMLPARAMSRIEAGVRLVLDLP